MHIFLLGLGTTTTAGSGLDFRDDFHLLQALGLRFSVAKVCMFLGVYRTIFVPEALV